MTTCCVDGCNKTFSSDPANVNKGNLYPVHSISYHRFPRKKALRQKWLTAIGRPNWDAPCTAHVCSQHFSSQQIEYLGEHLYKIKEDGYPDCVLPIVLCTSVQASNLEVCRFCLATNIKMFSLQAGVLKTCLETIVGLHENHDMDGLPQYLCYICAAYLIKMYNVIEKSMIAQATLLEIYAENLEITKNLTFEQNRQKLNLIHTLRSHNATPCHVYEYVYDDDLKTSVLVAELVCDKKEDDRSAKESSSGDTSNSESDLGAKRFNDLCRKLKQDIDESEELLTEIYYKPSTIRDDVSKNYAELSYSRVTKLNDKCHTDIESKTKDTCEKSFVQNHSKFDSRDSNDDNIRRKAPLFVYEKDHDYSRRYIGDKLSTKRDNIGNVEHTVLQDNKDKQKLEMIAVKHPKNLIKATNKNDLPIDEHGLDNYYNIVELTLREQKQQWWTSLKMPLNPLESNRCDICYKWVRRGKYYLQHIARHDPQCGEYQCKVCKVRFVKEHLLKKHVVMTHSRKYLCKSCPSVQYTIAAASYHRLEHRKRPNRRAASSRSFRSKAELLVHAATVHNNAPLLISPNQFVCKICNVESASQAAHRDHWATCPANGPNRVPLSLEAVCASTVCSECGQQCDTRRRLYFHMRNVHGPSARRGEYPAMCERCTVILKSPAHQRRHMLKLHPDANGKSVKLPPKGVSYECPICDNVFNTIATLNRHILNVHRQLPFTESAPSTEHVEYPELDGAIDEGTEVGGNLEVEEPTENVTGQSMKEDRDTDTCAEGVETWFDGDEEMVDAPEKDPLRNDDECCKVENDFDTVETFGMDD